MVEFVALISKFGERGDKSGWTYVEISFDQARKINYGNNKTFRVRGSLDTFPIAGVAVLPMGDGSFILPLNAGMRKGIAKSAGALVHVRLEADTEFRITMPPELEACLDDEPDALDFLSTLSPSHQRYFFKWIDSARTEETKMKRIEHTLTALQDKLDYGSMLRRLKTKNQRM